MAGPIRYYIAVSRMSEQETREIDREVRRLGGRLLVRDRKVETSPQKALEVWGPVTHCIKNAEGCYTFQDMVCAMLGKWVVSRAWIEQSISTGRWLPEAPFGRRLPPLTVPPTAGLFITMKFFQRERRSGYIAKCLRTLFQLAGGQLCADVIDATHIVVSGRDDPDHFLAIPGGHADSAAFTANNICAWFRLGGDAENFAERSLVRGSRPSTGGLLPTRYVLAPPVAYTPLMWRSRDDSSTRTLLSTEHVRENAVGPMRAPVEGPPAKRRKNEVSDEAAAEISAKPRVSHPARGGHKAHTAPYLREGLSEAIPLAMLDPNVHGPPARSKGKDVRGDVEAHALLTEDVLHAPMRPPLPREEALALWLDSVPPPCLEEVAVDDMTVRRAGQQQQGLPPVTAMIAEAAEPPREASVDAKPRKYMKYDPCDIDIDGSTQCAVVTAVYEGGAEYEIVFGKPLERRRVAAVCLRPRNPWTPTAASDGGPRDESPAPRIPPSLHM